MGARKSYNGASVARALIRHYRIGGIKYLAIYARNPGFDELLVEFNAQVGPDPDPGFVADALDKLTRGCYFRVNPSHFADYVDMKLDEAHAFVLGMTNGEKVYGDPKRAVAMHGANAGR